MCVYHRSDEESSPLRDFHNSHSQSPSPRRSAANSRDQSTHRQSHGSSRDRQCKIHERSPPNSSRFGHRSVDDDESEDLLIEEHSDHYYTSDEDNNQRHRSQRHKSENRGRRHSNESNKRMIADSSSSSVPTSSSSSSSLPSASSALPSVSAVLGIPPPSRSSLPIPNAAASTIFGLLHSPMAAGLIAPGIGALGMHPGGLPNPGMILPHHLRPVVIKDSLSSDSPSSSTAASSLPSALSAGVAAVPGGSGVHPPHSQSHSSSKPSRKRNLSRMSATSVDPHARQIFLKNVPRHLNTLEQMASWFSRFGEAENIQVHRDQGTAYIQFSSHNEADDALQCDEAVLGDPSIVADWARYNRLDFEKKARISSEQRSNDALLDKLYSAVNGEGADSSGIKRISVAQAEKERDNLLAEMTALKSKQNYSDKSAAIRELTEQTRELLEMLESLGEEKTEDEDTKELRKTIGESIESNTNNLGVLLAKQKQFKEIESAVNEKEKKVRFLTAFIVSKKKSGSSFHSGRGGGGGRGRGFHSRGRGRGRGRGGYGFHSRSYHKYNSHHHHSNGAINHSAGLSGTGSHGSSSKMDRSSPKGSSSVSSANGNDSDQSCKVTVTGLAKGLDISNVRSQFQKFGNVMEVDTNSSSKSGEITVTFESRDAALKAFADPPSKEFCQSVQLFLPQTFA